jgi:hypothetical protein
MRSFLTTVFALVLLLSGCDSYRGPRLALPTGPSRAAESASVPSSPTTPPARSDPERVYSGKKLADWGKALESADRDDVIEACRALHVLGPEGRPYLFAGLDSPRAETRRLCFERLTVADFKREGEEGRRRLLKLAGDKGDIRIRERAASFLSAWHGSLSAP